MTKMTQINEDEAACILRELLYNPDTGDISHRVTGKTIGRPNWNRTVAQRASGLRSTCYIKVSFRNRVYYAHHLACLFMLGAESFAQIVCIDHEDEDGTHNWWRNLNYTDVKRNSASARSRPNVTGYRGVSPRGKRFAACFYGHFYLGRHDVADEAAEAVRRGCAAIGLKYQRLSPRNKTGLYGVYPRDGRFLSELRTNEFLGTYDTAAEAHAVWCRRATEVYGEYARIQKEAA